MSVPVIRLGIPARRKPEKPAPNKHDSLHLGKSEGLRYCWCKCRHCWSVSFAVKGIITGFCICPDCPCRRETEKALRGRHAH
jgi:hypothetical protein